MSEGYQGVKFKVNFLYKAAPIDIQLDVLKKWCGIFHEKGLAPPYTGGSYGNLSFRTSNQSFIITGTCMGLKGNLTDDCFVEVMEVDTDNLKIIVNGTRFPSSETMLHDAIYKLRPEVNAVFHGHCDALVKNATNLGLPETANEKPYGTFELVTEVLSVINENDFIIIKNHGFIALGNTMNQAGKLSLDVLKKLK